MTKLAASDVEAAIEALEDIDGYWGELEWALRDRDTLEVNGESYPISIVSEEHGGEGSWDTETFIVVRVGDQLFRKTGHYRSHYGDDWDGPFREVEAVQRLVDDYKEVTR